LKKAIYILISIFILSIVSLIIYWNLPFEITRKSEINYGNTLIENINKYKIQNNKLPGNDDWKTLRKIGFKIEILGTNPSYETNGNDEYEIIFLEGFDGPYLMWNSKEKNWKISFPKTFVNSNDTEENTDQTTPTKINGSAIIFLRPNDEKFKEVNEEEGIYEVDSDFGFGIQKTIDGLKTNSKFSKLKYEILTDRFIKIEDCKDCPKIIDRDTIYYGLILTAKNEEIKIITNVQSLGYLQTIEDYFK